MSQAGAFNLANSGAASVLEFTGGAGTSGAFPVTPNIAGAIGLSSTDGSIDITGGANSLDFSSGIYRVSGTLTSAQIKNLHATPIQIIAAPGANKIIQIIHYMATFNYGGSNVFVAAAGQRVNLTYGTMAANLINIITNIQLVDVNSIANTDSPVLDTILLSEINNIELNLNNPEATEISGNAANDNTISYNVVYRIFSI